MIFASEFEIVIENGDRYNLSGREGAVGGLIKLFVVSSFGRSCREQRLPREQQCGTIIPTALFQRRGKDYTTAAREEEGLKRHIRAFLFFFSLSTWWENSNEGELAKTRQEKTREDHLGSLFSPLTKPSGAPLSRTSAGPNRTKLMSRHY